MTPITHVLRPSRPARFGPVLPMTTLIGFWIAMAAVIVMAALSYGALQGSLSNARGVTHTLQLVEQLQGLLSTMKDAETGQRGFLLTGDEDYLAPYTNARAALAGEIDSTRGLLLGNSAQLLHLQVLEQLCADKMAELAQTIALRRKGDAAGALADVRTDRGKDLMDHIRAVSAEMLTEERQTLASRQATWLSSARTSSFVTLGGAAAAAGIRGRRGAAHLARLSRAPDPGLDSHRPDGIERKDPGRTAPGETH